MIDLFFDSLFAHEKIEPNFHLIKAIVSSRDIMRCFRSGRTGRAGRRGNSVVLYAQSEDEIKLRNMESLGGFKFNNISFLS